MLLLSYFYYDKFEWNINMVPCIRVSLGRDSKSIVDNHEMQYERRR